MLVGWEEMSLSQLFAVLIERWDGLADSVKTEIPGLLRHDT